MCAVLTPPELSPVDPKKMTFLEGDTARGNSTVKLYCRCSFVSILSFLSNNTGSTDTLGLRFSNNVTNDVIILFIEIYTGINLHDFFR